MSTRYTENPHHPFPAPDAPLVPVVLEYTTTELIHELLNLVLLEGDNIAELRRNVDDILCHPDLPADLGTAYANMLRYFARLNPGLEFTDRVYLIAELIRSEARLGVTNTYLNP